MTTSHLRSICAPCRRVDATAPDTCRDCAGPMIQVSSRWRAPKRRNLRAWSRIAAGEVNWDRRAARTEVHNGVPDRLVTTRSHKGHPGLGWLSEVNAARAARGKLPILPWPRHQP